MLYTRLGEQCCECIFKKFFSFLIPFCGRDLQWFFILEPSLMAEDLKPKNHHESAFKGDRVGHTPNIAFRHLPPNSTRFSYATEGALFISAQLSSDAVSALWKVRVLIWL